MGIGTRLDALLATGARTTITVIVCLKVRLSRPKPRVRLGILGMAPIVMRNGTNCQEPNFTTQSAWETKQIIARRSATGITRTIAMLKWVAQVWPSRTSYCQTTAPTWQKQPVSLALVTVMQCAIMQIVLAITSIQTPNALMVTNA